MNAIARSGSESGLERIRQLAGRLDRAYVFEMFWPLMEYLDELVCIANKNGYFIRLNQSWTKLLGWSQTELLSHPWLEFIHPDDMEKTIAAAKTMEEKPIVGFTNRYLCKNGTYREIKWFAMKWDDSGFTLCIAKDNTKN